MEYLVVRLADEHAISHWAVFDGDGRIVRRLQVGVEGLAEAGRGRRVVALVPGFDVIGTQATLPSASAARLRKMLPYSLEDALADDIDELFFAVGPRLEAGAVSVAVVATPRVEAWLERLHALGLAPTAIYSESEGVPDTPGALTLVIEDERIYGRVSGRPAFAFEGLALTDVVNTLTAEDDAPRHATIYADEAGRRRHERALRDLADKMARVDLHVIADGAFYRLASTLINRPAANLLQGPFAPKSSWDATLRPWRAAAALFAAFLLLLVIGEAAQVFSLHRDDNALSAAVAARCQQLFGASQLNACESAVRARLGQSGMLDEGGVDFLTTLAAVADSGGNDRRVEALSFRNRVMDLQVVVSDVPALEQFAQQIEGSGPFEVAIQSANPGQTGVEGRMQIVGAAR